MAIISWTISSKTAQSKGEGFQGWRGWSSNEVEAPLMPGSRGICPGAVGLRLGPRSGGTPSIPVRPNPAQGRGHRNRLRQGPMAAGGSGLSGSVSQHPGGINPG